MNCNKRLRPAFTLVELLACIGVLVVLALLTIPLTNAVQAQARSAESAGNMRQIGVGLLLYSQDHYHRLPGSSHQGRQEESWIFTLAPYLDQVDDIRICPADTLAEERRQAQTTSYTLNGYLVNPEYDSFTGVVEDYGQLHRLARPAETFLLFPLSPGKGTAIAGDHTHSRSWTTWGNVLADIEPDRHRTGDSAPEHLGGHGNYLFADGHVEAIEASNLKARVDSGDNFARPPL